MFKSLTVHKINAPAILDYAEVASKLQEAAFVAGGAQQEKSFGWVPPRGEEHGAFVESINGQWLALFKIQTRTVQSDALKARIAIMSEAYESTNGRAPGRKMLREMKEDALMEMLPNVFPREITVPVWIDPAGGRVSIGSTTQSKVDEVVSALVRSIPNLAIEEVTERDKTVAAMRVWLMLEADQPMPDGMSLGNQCVLRQDGESKATARFSNQNLACDEVRQNLRTGKDPLALGLSWGEHVDLVLHSSGRLKSIRLSSELQPDAAAKEAGSLDADFTLFTATMGPVIEQLVREIDQVFTRIEDAKQASDSALKGIATMWAPLADALAEFDDATSVATA